MTTIRLSHEINAPVGEVFEIADRHENYPQVFQDFEKVRWTTPRHRVGTRLRMDAKLGSALLPVEVKTTAVEPGRRICGVFVSGLEGSLDWDFAQEGDSTWVTLTAQYKLPGRELKQFLDRTAVDQALCKGMLKALANVKSLVENRKAAA